MPPALAVGRGRASLPCSQASNVYAMDMKQVVQVKLLADPEQTVALLRTMEAFTAACNVVAEVAFVEHTADKIRLQPVVYGRIRGEFGLSAQMAVRCISKACAAYKRDKRIQPTFRPHRAMPYDERILAYKAAGRAHPRPHRIWPLPGRPPGDAVWAG